MPQSVHIASMLLTCVNVLALGSLYPQLLKNRYRLLTKQKESEVKQSSWQAFAGGKGKKRVKGTLKGLRKVSIFKSPEVGGKVGVVGSGQGTTAYDSKKRYKLN